MSTTAVTATTTHLTLKTNEVRRGDYKPTVYTIEHVNLDFNLDYQDTQVNSELRIHRNPGSPAFADLVLHGAEHLDLKSIALQLKDQPSRRPLSPEEYQRFTHHDHGLLVKGHLLPEKAEEEFKLFITVRINPSTNTELMGLYKAGGILCTQCEAEGFRRITYFLDRPDVMATFQCRLEANKATFPVLLSNGNCIASGDIPHDRHFVVFQDPYRKPSYLFAVVAGELALKHSEFVRCTGGRPVSLRLWCEPKDANKLDWAMESLKRAMKWDEERFGLVYDLDLFNIVAVPFFNMGAMENKSLNVFNSALLLASPQTTTDSEFQRILGVVGHEYFHNWTGNRVTCRDWFQLTLKEGLTVYRDQEFSSDMGDRSIQRISHVNNLRTFQFTEDDGPMAHPVRPEQYRKIDNFYTSTVYYKGAEVVRLYESLYSREGFRRGMELYFQRHDGHAVTCDDFRQAMVDANPTVGGIEHFELWYSQAGTPVVTLEKLDYDATKQTFVLGVRQDCPSTPGQPVKKPFVIPIAVGLIGCESRREIHPTKMLLLNTERQEFVFHNIAEVPVVSFLRNFSAPVKVVSPLTDDEYGLLMAHDTDDFNRYDAGQSLMAKAILKRATHLRDEETDPGDLLTPTLKLVLAGMRATLALANLLGATGLDFLAHALGLPTVPALMVEMRPCDPVALHRARKAIKEALAKELRPEFVAVYDRLSATINDKEYDLSLESIGARALRNMALVYLVAAGDVDLAVQHYKNANNITDRLTALHLLVDFRVEATQWALDDFFAKSQGDDSVIDKWFRVQVLADREDVIDTIRTLQAHKLFDMTNPNRVRSLFQHFAALNPGQFHRSDGEGYRVLADFIAQVDEVNARTAASLSSTLLTWQTMEPNRAKRMKDQLERLAKLPLSEMCDEIVSKGLKP